MFIPVMPGISLTPTRKACDVARHPLASVIVTVYIPPCVGV